VTDTSSSNSAISPKAYEVASQFAHFFSAFGLVFAPAVFFGRKGMLAASLGMLVWASVKEFYWDYAHQNAQTRGSSARDFLFYSLGNAAAVGLGLLHNTSTF
jgi:hypothetical protein